MRRQILVLTAGLAAVSIAAGPTAATAATASASLSGAAGVSGSASLADGPSGVLLKLELSGLSPGWHAVHFHEKGDCSDAKFTSAGGHINHAAAKKPHGLLNPEGPDMGDLPNVFVATDKKGQMQAFSALVSVSGSGDRPALLDADGSAVVVHANPDDYTTQSIGGAGDRVACGVIKAAP